MEYVTYFLLIILIRHTDTQTVSALDLGLEPGKLPEIDVKSCFGV